MAVKVKICGLSTAETVAAAVEAGAEMIGFVFYPRSPRAVLPAQAKRLVAAVPGTVKTVGLFVDPEPAALEAVLREVPLDVVQLHGEESPGFVAGLRQRLGLPVMKAIRIGSFEDVARAEPYVDAADRLLFDARPKPESGLPGGNGLAFDWTLLAGRNWPLPWMLSGGLSPGNLAEAVRITGASALDVSSGVETSPGIKDPALIRAFVKAARALG